MGIIKMAFSKLQLSRDKFVPIKPPLESKIKVVLGIFYFQKEDNQEYNR
jgi:hypothetical protein